MSIQDRIKSRREELGLSIRSLALALDVNPSTILRYETNEIQNMGIDKVESLAKALRCSPSYLMGWTDIPDISPMCAGGRASEDDPNYSNALAYTIEQIRANGEKHALLPDDMQRLDRMLQLFDRLDLIDQERIIERIETLLESDKYRKGEN